MCSDKPPLENSKSDYVASAAKAVVGAVPFVGSLLTEIAGNIIPNQRLDRLARFAVELHAQLQSLEETVVRAKLTNENFTDLMEDALRQAARSTTDDRRRYIAKLVASSLSQEHIDFVESKHLLRILGELNDVELVWLRFYLDTGIRSDAEFRARHEAVLAPRRAFIGGPPEELDKDALQTSYKDHLAQLGLLRHRHEAARTPNLGLETRSVVGFDLTALGRLLLRFIGLAGA